MADREAGGGKRCVLGVHVREIEGGYRAGLGGGGTVEMHGGGEVKSVALSISSVAPLPSAASLPPPQQDKRQGMFA